MAPLLRILTATAVMIALLGAPSALAAKKSARTAKAVNPVALAQSIASDYWGATPCGGAITVSTRQRLVAGLDGGSDAWVTFATPFGANDLSAPAAGYAHCQVFLTTARWPSRVSMHQDWDMLCMTMVHEYGHLLGHPHDLTPHSIMAPVFTDYSAEPRGCRNATL